ncbi:MAG: adenylate/guanylate cyclase domain-containing protein [Pseudomonadota bacterium]
MKKWRLWKYSLERLLGLSLLAALIALRFFDPQILENVRNQSFDFYQQIKPREAKPQPIAIVDLDEQSLRQYGQWPWPRTRIAELIDKLTQLGAVTIAFDIIFSEPDRLSPKLIADDNSKLPNDVVEALRALPDNEIAMAKSMRKSRVIVGQTSVRSEEDNQVETQEIRDAPHAKIGNDPTGFLTSLPDLVQNMSVLEDAASGRGVFSVRPDPDGIYRRVPLVMLVQDKIRLALSIELLRVATGGESFLIKTNEVGIENIVVANQKITTDERGRVWPYFSSINSSRRISIASILDGTVDPVRVRGHLVLIGTSATGLEDYRAIPLGTQVPGVEIHAQVLENILSGQLLTRSSLAIAYEIVAVTLIGLFIIWLVPIVSAVVAFVSAGTFIAITIAISYWYFANERLLFDASWPTITFATLFIGMATANYMREERERQQIRGAFGQYLSPALVDQLSDDPTKLVLGGETRELSLLFMDVRGFTAISESYKEHPQGLTQLMNRFLTVLSQPILEQNGTIDKYMGDAIMAFWNAPVNEKEHAYKACISSLKMMENVKQLNETRKQELSESDSETWLEINIGIGINTGDCVVGNMGSDNRFDYTALGDTVNLASRLEGQSKPYGLPIVLGDATAKAVEERLATFEIDIIRVKGKNEPVRIYALAGDEGMLDSDDFTAMRAMNKTLLSSYRNQDWISAYEALELMEPLGEKLNLNLKNYLFLYETRISEFRENPPGNTWDGVYTATSK